MAIVFKTPISALNTTTKDIQNIKQGDCPPCPEPVVESTSEEYTSNGEYTLTPKEGVDGFSQVEITVNVPSDVNNQNKDVTISQNGEQTISADSGYTGLGEVSVTVAVDVETPYNEGYAAGETAGIATGKAEGVAEQKAKLTSTTITENGTTTREDGWNSVTVNVDVTTPYNNGVAAGEAAQKAKLTSGTFVSNGTYNREDGYNSITVNVPSDINNQDKTVNPSTTQQTVSADNGYSGLGQVTVNAVTSSIDQNIQPENIVKGVTILGVNGTYVPTLEEGTYAPEYIGTTTIEPETDGYSSVEITVPAAPIGSPTNPFYEIQSVLDTDFEEGYYEAPIASGEMNERTGYYDAVADVDQYVFHIKPYLVNPHFDPENPDPEVPEYIFPEDFDLASKDIVVFFNKANINTTYDRETLVGVEFNDCTLYTVDYNSNPDSWPFGTLRVTENGTVNPYGYAEIEVDVQPSLESKTASYTANGTYTITPSTGYDGMSDVEVTVNVSGGSGTQCPDWSSIGWDCSDVTGSGIDADLAYTAQIKTEYENGRGHLGNADRLVYAPKITNLPNNCSEFFVNDSKLRYVPLLNTSNVTDMQRMFAYCSMLKTVPLFNTSNVTKMNSMFTSCSNLEYISAFDTSNVTNMNGMFQRCNILSTIPLLDTSSVTDMSYMFNYAKMLNGANLPLLDTSNVTNMEGMFSGVNGQYLTTIPQFNTSKVTTMKLMFDGCDYLTTIPQLNTASVQSVDGIFGQYSYMACTALTTIGGFVNLGKGFISTGTANDHRLNLQ